MGVINRPKGRIDFCIEIAYASGETACICLEISKNWVKFGTSSLYLDGKMVMNDFTTVMLPGKD